MTFSDHMAVWNGLYPDLDNAYGPQCMDEMHLYHVEVLGLTNKWYLAASGPKDIWNNWENILGHDYFDKIPNTPTGIPQEGDIVLWSMGTFGHVAIFIEGDINRFRSFEQNYPTGYPCHVQEHTSYASILGWLHYKGPASIEVQLDQVRKERDENHNDRMALYEELGFTGVFNRTVAIEKIKMLMSIETQVKLKDEQLKEAQEKIAQLQKTAGEKEIELKTLKDDIIDLNARITIAIDDNQRLQKALSEAQEASQKPVYTGFKKWLYETFLR